MRAPPPQSLTLKSNGGLLNVLQTACGVCMAFEPSGTPREQHPQMHMFTAIWDTGATASAISPDVVRVCQLKPIGMSQVHTANGVMDAELYLVNIGLVNGVGFSNVPVTQSNLGPHTQMLIGMDIITRGDFSITNVGGRTIFSFRVPSVKAVDFVEAANQAAVQAAPTGGTSSHRVKHPKHFGKNKKRR